jgi:hypothetical protein
VRFHLSEPLLVALRRRRAEQRLAQAKRVPARPQEPPQAAVEARSLVGVVQELFSAKVGVEAAAAGYVSGMDGLQEDVEVGHDAFLLDPGMGPMLDLTGDGRVLVDGRSWDGEALREADDAEAIAALVVGAKKTEIEALLDLIPRRPDDGESCPMCEAELMPGHGPASCALCAAGGAGSYRRCWTKRVQAAPGLGL